VQFNWRNRVNVLGVFNGNHRDSRRWYQPAEFVEEEAGRTPGHYSGHRIENGLIRAKEAIVPDAAGDKVAE